jgi:ketosteroid isomerase-like protein
MSQRNVEIALRQLEAFNRRDTDAVVAFVSPDVEWEDSMFRTAPARVHRGRAALREWLDQILEPWESIRVEAEEIYKGSDGRVFAHLLLTARGVASGVETQLHGWIVLWFANGEITRRRVFRDRAEALEAAGLSE